MKTGDLSSEWKIPLYKIFTDDEDLQLLNKIIKRGTYWAMGPEIEEFEKAVAEYVGVDYCLTLNSGTSALHASLLAHELGKNDEIIVPSFSFVSTANSTLFVNSKPVFADIEESNLGLDPELLTKKITDKTKAIIPMDYGGMSCKIFEIKDITENNNLILIEDAAESLGSSVKNHKVGSVSDTSIFSFCGNKVLTTGEGGAVVTKSRKIYEKIKLIRSHGRLESINYFDNPNTANYLELGYNWRMSTITASLGLTQLLKLDKIIKMRKNNANFLSKHLSKFSEIRIPTPQSDYENIYQMYPIRLGNNSIRDNLQKFLVKKRIFSKIYFSPIHLMSYYKNQFSLKEGFLPITEKISQEILCLPIFPNMTNEEKNYIVDSISEFFEKN